MFIGFHAFTGCDPIPSIRNKGKKTCWDLWQKYPEFTAAFSALSQMSPSKDDIAKAIPILNKYVARLFQITDQFQDVDSLRLHLFFHTGKSFESIPPSSDAVTYQAYRAAFEGGHIWAKTLVPVMNPPSPSEWGWIESPIGFRPQYTSKDIISRKLPALRTCGCQVKCEPPCTCCVLAISCTGLCGCKGYCFGKRRKNT